MKRIILFAVLFACLASVPFFTTREYILSLIILVCLYTILSHSWNLLGGFTGQISLGHSTFFGIGALVFRYLWLKGVPPYLALGSGFSFIPRACLSHRVSRLQTKGTLLFHRDPCPVDDRSHYGPEYFSGSEFCPAGISEDLQPPSHLLYGFGRGEPSRSA